MHYQENESLSPLHCKKNPSDRFSLRSFPIAILGITIIFHGKLRTKHGGDRTDSFNLLKFSTVYLNVASARVSSSSMVASMIAGVVVVARAQAMVVGGIG